MRWSNVATLLAGAVFVISGCAPLARFAQVNEPLAVYDLTPKSTFDDDLSTVEWQLVVEEPTAARGIDTDRIVVRTRPTQIKYYAHARWSDRAPRLIQTLLVESFENTRRIVSVGRQAVSLRSDFKLLSELREFQIELYGAQAPSAHVRLSAKVVKQPDAKIIASQSFEHAVPAASTDMNDIVVAFDEALGRVLRKTVEWTLRVADNETKNPSTTTAAAAAVEVEVEAE